MRKSDPISIDAGRESKGSKRTSTKNSSTQREKTPSAAKGARTRQSAGADSAKSAKATSKGRSSKRDTSKGAEQQMNSAASNPAPQLPENHHPGLHDRSYAAHLDAGPRGPHTKPAGDLRFLAPFPTGRKQP
ncbi:hypothetical protein [Occallatibacter riparius]|uniref:Uncharacterized protein n=1 Tax=Occallatibacter riparius TaxID=1002689 RepID=A0A9J7BQT6_9BACT|nr:hypothetical protein [Occallatibacter riparius]UWZ84943.1 hypothetical protein MOP44_03145 [Occallatibacter riparius]